MNESVFSWSWQFHAFVWEPTPGGNILLHPLSQVSLPGPTLLVHDPGVTGEFGKFNRMSVLFAWIRPLGVEFKSSLTIVAAHDFGERCKRLVFHRCFQDASYDIICQLQVNHSKKLPPLSGPSFVGVLTPMNCCGPVTSHFVACAFWTKGMCCSWYVRSGLNSKSFSYGRDGHEP